MTSCTIVFVLVFGMFSSVDMGFEVVPKVEGATITVDDSGGADHTNIQDGIDAAQTGDTVYVYSGDYIEKIVINKRISLIGENRATTFIDGMSPSGEPTVIIFSSQVTLSGFKIFGSGDGYPAVHINSNSNTISNNHILLGDSGIYLNSVTGNVISNNIVDSIYGISLYSSNSNTITINSLSNCDIGILVSTSDGNDIINNTVLNNGIGIYLWDHCNSNTITDNTISNNGIGIHFWQSNGNTAADNTMLSNTNAIMCMDSINDYIINSTISNSGNYDFFFESHGGLDSHITSLNTSFDKSKTYFEGPIGSILTVKWYLHVNVTDYLGNPVPTANVQLEDNLNGSYKKTFTTNISGIIRWIPVTEYIEKDTDGDTIGEKTYFTPYRIIAWNDTLVGYAKPDPLMDQSKTVNIILRNGTLLDLDFGWNLVSLPRPQSNTNLHTVLQSIEGRYDCVQWYNISDNNDPWKHNHITKSSSTNDLNLINNTMGFWIHVTNPGGTTFILNGTKPVSNQYIQLYKGWNLVGYPSLTNHNRTMGLNNLEFGKEVDCIQWFDSSTKTWHFMQENDFFEIGRGYWIHAKSNCVWEVPL